MNRAMAAPSRRQAVLILCVVLLVLFTAFPFVWMIATAFKPPTEIFVYPPRFFPEDPTLENIRRLFDQTRFLTYFRNSVFVSSMTVLLTLVIATPRRFW